MQTGLTLYPYQKAWLKDPSRFAVGMFARQSGKTFASALGIVEDCIRSPQRWVILSRGERQAREMMDEHIKRLFKVYQAAFEVLEYDLEGSHKALEVTLPNGSRVTALPANPDTARGFSANVLLDEFAFHQDSRKIWGALYPVISKPGLRLRVISTPNGKGNKFYDLVTGQDAAWSRHRVDIYEAVGQGLDRNIEELREGIGDSDLWAQEYELAWLDEASAWLSYDLINTCESDLAALDGSGYEGGEVYIGNDIGLRGDLWVAWALELVGDVLWTREVRTLKRSTFAEHDAVLEEMFGKYNVRRLCIDQTGMGERSTETYTKRYGSSRVEGVIFGSNSKQGLAMLGKQAFEDRRLRIPAGDPAIRKDLHKLQKVVTAAGTVRFNADRDAAGHADRAWALFLAINAASNPKMVYEFRSDGLSRSDRQLRSYGNGYGAANDLRGFLDPFGGSFGGF